MRWTCSVCPPSFDLCGSCYAKGQHYHRVVKTASSAWDAIAHMGLNPTIAAQDAGDMFGGTSSGDSSSDDEDMEQHMQVLVSSGTLEPAQKSSMMAAWPQIPTAERVPFLKMLRKHSRMMLERSEAKEMDKSLSLHTHAVAKEVVEPWPEWHESYQPLRNGSFSAADDVFIVQRARADSEVSIHTALLCCLLFCCSCSVLFCCACLQTMSHDPDREGKDASAAAAGAPGGAPSAAAERALNYPTGLLHEDELHRTHGSKLVLQGANALKTLFASMVLLPNGKEVATALKVEMNALGIAYQEVVDAYLEKREKMKVSLRARTACISVDRCC